MVKPVLVFVTPCYGRYELTRLCLEQRSWACDRLKEQGINATSVVVADDENLDVATELGFERVRRQNDYLGARFNDGYEYAAVELGAEYVVPIGSDSWVDPGFIAQMLPRPAQRVIVYSRHYAMIRKDGKQRAHLFVEYEGGVTMCMPTRLLAPAKFRPCGETLPRGCDTSTLRTLKGLHRQITFRTSEVHDLETVSFRSEQQISDYSTLFQRWGVGVAERTWAGLKDVYPPELVERAKQFYA